MGGIVCETCDVPDSPADVQFRLICVDGMWDDAENPLDPAATTLASTGRVPPTAPSATDPDAPLILKSFLTCPEGRWASPDDAVGFWAACAHRTPQAWLYALTEVFTSPEREAAAGWFDPADWYEALEALRGFGKG